ncbi:hypothetical protein L593_12090 [Salinarchaeum sp. Harcht-Bsk1]|uniref:hypothetical protein n=1 Tax=Salinarchaeum sp. Harcht-Bsk1 TaxID=1333523 RepID=UPI0003424627|nr:hypothetical protein [Salinarchaeum sp. Harcht-Bsk1]AGN02361.1 hypothetical protein L593_12090 [Salinarchaeum sp. Harcht-Bsk1]
MVNLVLAGAASLLAAVIAPPLAAAVFAVSVLVIYFRGYLVPGTPELTKRYLPDSVLARFDHAESHPAESGGTGVRGDETGTGAGADDASDGDEPEFEAIQKLEEQRANEVDPETFLQDNGVIEPGPSDDPVLTDAFTERVARHLEGLAVDDLDDGLATLFEVEPAELEHVDRDYPAIKIDARIRQWPSEAALLADVAAHEALLASDADWLDVPLEQRLNLLESLRSFRQACPACGGSVVGNESVVQSCCRSFDVVTMACEDCEARILELPAHAADGIDTPGGTLR